MKCTVCGKNTRDLKNDLCFRCYVINHAIRLEPNMPHFAGSGFDSPKPASRLSRLLNLRPFITDVNSDARRR